MTPKLVFEMPGLAQLLADHSRILVLDAASTEVAVGLLRGSAAPIWRSEAGDATRGVFQSTQAVLAEAGLSVGELDAFLFCAGPGSMLGIRTVAMALRSWLTLGNRPTFSYQSLALAARHEWLRRRSELSIVADARRDTWHVQSISADGSLAPLRRVATAALPTGELLTPDNFRAWSAAPARLQACRYVPADLFTTVAEAELFTRTDSPDAFQHESPAYLKWSAQLHSAESVARK